MKTKIPLLALLITAFSFAQNGINYKAVIKNNLGNVVTNQAVKIRFTILKGAANVYQETHLPITDANGIAIVNIGLGTPVSGSFTSITWGAGAHSLKVEIDPAGGNTFVNMGTTEFKSVPYALNVTGLEKITEGGKTGWRLSGKDPAYYGDIGINAVDLSDNNINISTSKGATGSRAFAMGHATTALGIASTASGSLTVASGIYSTAMGNYTVASGSYSTAMGNGTEASGSESTAMGVVTTASGSASTSLGKFTRASGKNSTALGESTKSQAYASLALGRFNKGVGDSISWLVPDPLFEIGNGTSDAARSNALTVLKNGNVGIGIGNHIPESLLEVSHLDGALSITNIKNAFSIKNAGSLKSWQFHVNNSGALVLYRNGTYTSYFHEGTGAYVTVSDRRLKKDIVPLENNTLQKVMQLNPVSYQMKDQNDDERQIGLISQEVQKVFPSLTHLVPEKDILSLSYTEMIPILIKAIQEQQEVIKSMQLAVGSQQSIIKSQESKIKNLTAASEQKDESLKSFDNRLKQMESLLKQTNQ